MLRDTFFRVDPPRIDAELQRPGSAGILRHHADRALAMGLLDNRKRAEFERLVERVEDGALVPDMGRRGYVVSLGGTARLPREHNGVRIKVLTGADLDLAGLLRSGCRLGGSVPSPTRAPRTTARSLRTWGGTPRAGVEPSLHPTPLPPTWSTDGERRSDNDAPRRPGQWHRLNLRQQTPNARRHRLRRSPGPDPSPTPRQASEHAHPGPAPAGRQRAPRPGRPRRRRAVAHQHLGQPAHVRAGHPRAREVGHDPA